MPHNKRFYQSPDPNVSTHGSPGFCVNVRPLRASLSPGTAQLKRSVMMIQLHSWRWTLVRCGISFHQIPEVSCTTVVPLRSTVLIVARSNNSSRSSAGCDECQSPSRCGPRPGTTERPITDQPWCSDAMPQGEYARRIRSPFCTFRTPEAGVRFAVVRLR